ncbi:hypothetical protein LAG90_06165 [Marinilongibacter aquaticus]|uniref:hypothetical protein n=1 Tax=Marinilongibacter aquaticus TaxID=2975157 RepID=UPI0021BD8958|nr:hypothetical protein [Marinilongibacter aquaticus]UBM60226.1 hypothetical protein LAG90_06165 [Marinilongibacter aquaticus]
MKTLLSISFAILILLQAILPKVDWVCEMQKLPDMMTQYQEHRAKDGLSLGDFLALHYGSDKKSKEHQEGNKEHEKLPFHGQHHSDHSCVYIMPTFRAPQVAHFIIPLKKTMSSYRFSLSISDLDSLFQPPQA